MPSARGTARGIVRAGSRTSSPRVAIRAYPANAKKSSPAAWSNPAPPPDSPTSGRPAADDPRQVATTAARTASTSATIARVSHADFCTPP